MIDPSWPILKHGTWLYAKHVPCTVRILHGDIIYGSGDYEDPPDLREDRPCECFYIVYQYQGDNCPSHGGVFLTLAEAVAKVEGVVGESLCWH